MGLYLRINGNIYTRFDQFKIYSMIPSSSISIFVHSDLPARWRRGSGLHFGSEDPGSIPRLPSLRVGPLMARR